ncbi:MAG: ABC transporter substrate-binding protein [Armatimonadota bacterium]|nr:ABC transporter substrate-binding protein [Armatimonadota bacterium]
MRKVLALFTLVLALALGSLGTAGFSQMPPIKVGVLAPLSGFAAADGKSVLTGIQIAAEEINAKGGILGRRVELVTYDDQADPKQAVSFTRRLIELERVAFIIGGSYSGASLAASPVANEAGVLFMAAYAVHPDITRAKPFAFRMGLLGPVQGRVGAQLVKDLKLKRVAILTIQNDFGRALEAGFREHAKKVGLEVVFAEAYPPGNQNFTPLLTRLRGVAPDAIYASGYYAEAANLVRQARALGLRVPIIGQEGYDSPKFIELAGPAAEGVLLTTTLDRDSRNPEVQGFLKKYRERAGIPADMVAASGFSALKVMALSVEKANRLDSEAVRWALRSLTNLESAVGHIYYFTEDGDPVKTATVQVVRNGEFRRFRNYTDLSLLKP